jgi:hypothetical protein
MKQQILSFYPNYGFIHHNEKTGTPQKITKGAVASSVGRSLLQAVAEWAQIRHVAAI